MRSRPFLPRFRKALLFAAAFSAAPRDVPAQVATAPKIEQTTPSSASALVARHDRALIGDLLAYTAKDPAPADAEQAYLAVFELAIKNDWFVENEPAARKYLDTQPDGSVRPLAQIVVIMAGAQAGKFDQATTDFERLIQGLDEADQADFVISFADSLAEKAVLAGNDRIARRVYETVKSKFAADEPLRDDMQRKIVALDRIGRPVAEFQVRDLKGNTIKLADLKGKYVLLDFWATWCAPCVDQLPAQIASYGDWHARGVEIVGISLDDAPEDVSDFVKLRNVPWPQVHHATCGTDLVAAFGVEQLPASFLIGPDGTLVRVNVRGTTLAAALKELAAAAK